MSLEGIWSRKEIQSASMIQGARMIRDPRAIWFRSLALALLGCAVLFLPRALLAQASPTEIGPGSYFAVGGTASLYQSAYGQRTLGGASVYADANMTWRYGLESEARWLNQNEDPATHAHETTYLAGPRYSFRAGGIAPYAKLLVGEGVFSFPYNYAEGHYLVMAPGAGVDLKVGPRIRLRLIDVEYQVWPQFSFGAIHPYGVSFGLSYRIF